MKRRYAELHAHSAFTFLDGTDEPARMVEEAARLGLDALAILDERPACRSCTALS